MVERKVKRALISVSDKRGIVEFAKGLASLGVEIISTGGTRKILEDAGIPTLYVSDVTGFPEILNGRVKTLHPAIHAGILARRGDAGHMETLAEQRITPIDLVAVNLYPFREAAAKPGAEWEDLIENIDIGGPSMLRSAAKNHEDVIVLVHPEDYDGVLAHLRRSGGCPANERTRLALAAFSHTAEYDACIYETLSARCSPEERDDDGLFPSRMQFSVRRTARLRYGENPAQKAALYRHAGEIGNAFIDAEQLQGKELSYNNWLDGDSAFHVIRDLDPKIPAAVILKHTNPCGAAIAPTLEEAFEKALAADPVSAFGGILAINRPPTPELAQKLAESFWEVLIAPAWPETAREILKAKTNLRLLEVPTLIWDSVDRDNMEWKSVHGGFLVQERDTRDIASENWKAVTAAAPSENTLRDLAFAWKIVKHVKSNAIVLVKDGVTVGIGAGQPNRVGAAEIALRQAGEKAVGSALASDAFFPFSDTVSLAADRGVTAIVQPGGSLRDQECIDAASSRDIAMFFTGIRHFRH